MIQVNILRVYSLQFTYDVAFLQVYTVNKIAGDMTMNFGQHDSGSGRDDLGDLTGYLCH